MNWVIKEIIWEQVRKSRRILSYTCCLKEYFLDNFCRILTMVCWYWTNCTFGLYPSSGVSKKLRNKIYIPKKSLIFGFWNRDLSRVKWFLESVYLLQIFNVRAGKCIPVSQYIQNSSFPENFNSCPVFSCFTGSNKMTLINCWSVVKRWLFLRWPFLWVTFLKHDFQKPLTKIYFLTLFPYILFPSFFPQFSQIVSYFAVLTSDIHLISSLGMFSSSFWA
jgi:hypothetical protein